MIFINQSIKNKLFLDNCIGLRIMKWLMRIADDSIAREYDIIYKAAVSYKIHANKHNVLPKPRHVIVEGNNCSLQKIVMQLIKY